jgi:acyl carrier protein
MAEQDIQRAVRQVMADVLDLDPGAITDETSVENTPRWDSANHIQLVLALEEEFSISFDVAELESMVSFGAVMRTLQGKLQAVR